MLKGVKGRASLARSLQRSLKYWYSCSLLKASLEVNLRLWIAVEVVGRRKRCEVAQALV